MIVCVCRRVDPRTLSGSRTSGTTGMLKSMTALWGCPIPDTSMATSTSEPHLDWSSHHWLWVHTIHCFEHMMFCYIQTYVLYIHKYISIFCTYIRNMYIRTCYHICIFLCIRNWNYNLIIRIYTHLTKWYLEHFTLAKVYYSILLTCVHVYVLIVPVIRTYMYTYVHPALTWSLPKYIHTYVVSNSCSLRIAVICV